MNLTFSRHSGVVGFQCWVVKKACLRLDRTYWGGEQRVISPMMCRADGDLAFVVAARVPNVFYFV
jgi:hypothetical protein